MLEPHHQPDHIAPRPAGMAFEILAAYMNAQRRMMVVVERTKHLIIHPGTM